MQQQKALAELASPPVKYVVWSGDGARVALAIHGPDHGTHAAGSARNCVMPRMSSAGSPSLLMLVQLRRSYAILE